MSEKTDRERTLRHPESKYFCGCVSSCMLTRTECRRKQVRCRYRFGEVRPLARILPESLRVTADTE